MNQKGVDGWMALRAPSDALCLPVLLPHAPTSPAAFEKLNKPSGDWGPATPGAQAGQPTIPPLLKMGPVPAAGPRQGPDSHGGVSPIRLRDSQMWLKLLGECPTHLCSQLQRLWRQWRKVHLHPHHRPGQGGPCHLGHHC